MKAAIAMALGGLVVLAASKNASAQGQLDFFIQAAPAAAANPAGAAADAGADDPQVTALRMQYEPLLKTELSFANRVCKWTKEERAAAVATANNWLLEFVRDLVKNNGRGAAMQMRGVIRIVGNGQVFAVGGGGAQSADKKLEEKLETAMTEQQRAAYDAERAKRDAFRIEATIDNLVAKMDQVLNLTPEQRVKVHDSLLKNWSDDWAPPLEMFVQMNEYVPAFPDDTILPHLTADQRVVWNGVQRISTRGMFFGGGMMGGEAQAIDDVNLHEGQ